MNASAIRLADELIAILFRCLSGFVMAGTSHASALADHSLDEVLRQSADLQQRQRLLAFRNTAASGHLDIRILSGFFQAFQNGLGHAAAIAEPFAEYAGFLAAVGFGFQFHAFGPHDRADFPEGQHIVRVAFDVMVNSQGKNRALRLLINGDKP